MHPIYMLEMSHETSPGPNSRVLHALQHLLEARAIIEGPLAPEYRPRWQSSSGRLV